jgi:hypothetical protein
MKEASSQTKDDAQSKRFWRKIIFLWAYLAIWFPVLVLSLYVKKVTLGERQYQMLAHVFHRESSFPAATHFTRVERLALYSGDFTVTCLVVPLMLLVVLVWLPRKTWAAIIASISIVLCAMLFFQMNSYRDVGHFIPWYLISDSLHWAVQHPEYVASYSSRSSIVKFAGLLGIILITAIVLHRAGTALQYKKCLFRCSGIIVSAFVVLGLAMFVLGMTTGFSRVSYGRGVLPAVLSATFLGNEDFHAMAKVEPAEELKWKYWKLTGVGNPSRDPRYWAKADGYDVILFILETGTYKYDSFEKLGDIPTLKRLSEKSWIGDSHYTTFPYTAKATFSILTSMYPPSPAFFGGAPRRVPGLVSALSSFGYDCNYYVPHAFETEFEDEMYNAIGFNNIFIGDNVRHPGWGQQHYQEVIRRDEQALDALKQDIGKLTGEDKRYLAVFSPQIGHGPWPDIISGGAETSLAKRARALLVLQDEWLGQIVQEISDEGRLDHTIIVVTGDHGIRTHVEDPSFEPAGLLADYTFHVPLLVYAPGILESAKMVTNVTSHIDIMPTILDLIGVAGERDFEQGLPIWDDRLDKRAVFLWAGDYLGAEGYHENDCFYVWNVVANFVYSGKWLKDDVGEAVAPNSAVGNKTIGLLNDMSKLDADWWVSAIRPREATEN